MEVSELIIYKKDSRGSSSSTGVLVYLGERRNRPLVLCIIFYYHEP